MQAFKCDKCRKLSEGEPSKLLQIICTHGITVDIKGGIGYDVCDKCLRKITITGLKEVKKEKE
jgi:hypothetical protein